MAEADKEKSTISVNLPSDGRYPVQKHIGEHLGVTTYDEEEEIYAELYRREADKKDVRRMTRTKRRPMTATESRRHAGAKR